MRTVKVADVKLDCLVRQMWGGGNMRLVSPPGCRHSMASRIWYILHSMTYRRMSTSCSIQPTLRLPLLIQSHSFLQSLNSACICNSQTCTAMPEDTSTGRTTVMYTTSRGSRRNREIEASPYLLELDSLGSTMLVGPGIVRPWLRSCFMAEPSWRVAAWGGNVVSSRQPVEVPGDLFVRKLG